MARSPLRPWLDRRVSHARPDYVVDAGGDRVADYANPVLAVTGIPAAIWPMSAQPLMAAAFQRMNIVTDHAIATDRDLGVKAQDKLTDADGTEYLVEGAMKFENFNFMRVTVYVIAANLRTP